jgi:hypothetical protein
MVVTKAPHDIRPLDSTLLAVTASVHIYPNTATGYSAPTFTRAPPSLIAFDKQLRATNREHDNSKQLKLG